MKYLHESRWKVEGRNLFENYSNNGRVEWDESYFVTKVVKEDWDELWHAYYWHKDSYDIENDYKTYVRVPKEVGQELFVNLI